MKEDHYAIWAWVVLGGIVTVFVAVYDIWATVTKHLTMTGQFRLWLHGEISGPLIAALWVGLFVGLTFHFLVKGH